eukprot:3319645-Rhodomonas_salina.1
MRVAPSLLDGRADGRTTEGREPRAFLRGDRGDPSAWIAVVTPRAGSGIHARQRASRVEPPHACSVTNCITDQSRNASAMPDNTSRIDKTPRCRIIIEEIDTCAQSNTKAGDDRDIEAQVDFARMLEHSVISAQSGRSMGIPDTRSHRSNICSLGSGKCSEIPAPTTTRHSAQKRGMDGRLWSEGVMTMIGVLVWAAELA